MKKIKLLLALVMVFSALCFGFRANAQATAPVHFYVQSNRIANWTTSSTWYLTLHNELTNVDTYFETHSYNWDSNGYFYVGRVEAGTYTVTVSYSSYYWDLYFDYFVNNNGWVYNYHMYPNTDYTLATGLAVSDDVSSADYGVTVYTYAN